MSEPPANPTRRWVAIVIAVAAVAWLSYGGVIHALASHYGASTNPGDWPRASKIEPANAENWYRLGRYRHLDFEHSDLPLAISNYRRAVQLDPHSAFYKLDLAGALEIAGNNAEAENYFRAAQKNYPISAEVSWRYGNFLLRQQRGLWPWIQNCSRLPFRVPGTAIPMCAYCLTKFCRIQPKRIGRRSPTSCRRRKVRQPWPYGIT